MASTPASTPDTCDDTRSHMRLYAVMAVFKPKKPTPDFPLFAHGNGQWAKKILGRLHYFGPWEDAETALANYRSQHIDSEAAKPQKGRMETFKVTNRGKPGKPYQQFPLFPHDCGSWAKKIRGKLHYFGPWNDPDGALQRYLDAKDDLHAGRSPRPIGEGTTVRDLLNHFLNSKRRLLDSQDIVERTFRDYKLVCDRMATCFDQNHLVEDLRAQDFEKLRSAFAATRGPTALANDITRIRSAFKYAYDAGLIEKPVRYGQALKKPSKKTLRLARLKNGERMFEAEQIRNMLNNTDLQLRAMILLGINCGFSNHDCGTLPKTAVNLQTRWLNFPRPKTANPRRCPLWPQTVRALGRVLASRRTPSEEAAEDLIFLTAKGNSWAKAIDDNPISKETRKLLIALDIHRKGLSFGALRHTFETIGGDTEDQVAVDFLMGHVADASDMAARYRQRISDDRLVKVVQHVRRWLYADQSNTHHGLP